MKRVFASLSLLVLLLTGFAHGESVSYSPAAGYFGLAIRGGSDNQLAIPLVQRAVSFCRVTGVAASQVRTSAGRWGRGRFAFSDGSPEGNYYAEFISGALKGAKYLVLDNSEDTLVLDTEGDDLTAHPMGAIAYDDVVRIRRHWTVGGVLGATDEDIVIRPKPNPLIPGDSVLFVDNDRVGENKAPIGELSYVRGVGWRRTGDLATDQQHCAFRVGEPFLVRRIAPDGVIVAVIGDVPTGPQALFVHGGDGVRANDAHVCLLFSEEVSLDESGLYDPSDPDGSVVRHSRNILLRADELLAYGDRAGFNQAPERAFFYLQSAGWREVGSASTTVGSDFHLKPGTAYIVRKKKTSPGVDWVQRPGN